MYTTCAVSQDFDEYCNYLTKRKPSFFINFTTKQFSTKFANVLLLLKTSTIFEYLIDIIGQSRVVSRKKKIFKMTHR
jgi:hypothetical protein